MAESIEQQIEKAVGKLQEYARALGKEKTKYLAYASKPVLDIMTRLAPKGKRIHYRYQKAGQGQRDPDPIAMYYPGNLRGSIQFLKFKKNKSGAVFIGPKFRKGEAKGVFGITKFDGYYAHMVEYRTKKTRAQPFIRPAADQGLPIALKKIEAAVKLFTKKYNNRYGIK